MEASRTRAEPRRNTRRNKGFEETHREMIATAVRLIAEKGADALSIAALARTMGINRTTVYYHFDTREALLDAAKSWATEQFAKGMDESAPQLERIGDISRFVVENPELMKLWIDDFVSGSDIRKSYTRWNELVDGIRQLFADANPGEELDAEVYCVLMLTAAFIGPRIFANSVEPGAATDDIVKRFLKEQERALKRDGLAR